MIPGSEGVIEPTDDPKMVRLSEHPLTASMKWYPVAKALLSLPMTF